MKNICLHNNQCICKMYSKWSRNDFMSLIWLSCIIGTLMDMKNSHVHKCTCNKFLKNCIKLEFQHINVIRLNITHVHAKLYIE